MATKRTLKKAETMAAKAAAKETPVKSVAAAPVEKAVKAETSKAEITKEAVAKPVVKETVVKEPAAKAPAAKEPAKPAAKRTTTVRKPAAKKAAPAEINVYVQFLGKEILAKDVVANIKKVFTEETGKKEEDIKDMKVYMKPEENKAYYVINEDVKGCVEL